ncbi:malonate transporter subunit MadM [Sandarakinorhabdus sp. AAP62]|uniref:malonate transporter subunit MadM n=1 Tax=Sandarakinorhabdus sp. AAP62 TaxID=1248916 RepID=UPI0002F317FF|nr:malonate transporter subunit MadM [Sandarakinorhabdus sp. AAP62]
MTARLADFAGDNGLLVAFVFVGLVMAVAYALSRHVARGTVHGSAIAIALGLLLAFWAGADTGGTNGVADWPLLAGIGVLGGNMFRDFAIVATAFGVRLADLRAAGLVGALSILIGVVLSFAVGAAVAIGFGITDPAEIATIGAGAATYIVGPVTGASLGVSSSIISLSIAAGLVKAVLVMVTTPLVARRIGLDNPASAMIYGGLMGTTSGVTGGLAATDPRLVPYGAMTSTFYTGLGCLMAPSVLYLAVKALV